MGHDTKSSNYWCYQESSEIIKPQDKNCFLLTHCMQNCHEARIPLQSAVSVCLTSLGHRHLSDTPWTCVGHPWMVSQLNFFFPAQTRVGHSLHTISRHFFLVGYLLDTLIIKKIFFLKSIFIILKIFKHYLKSKHVLSQFLDK